MNKSGAGILVVVIVLALIAGSNSKPASSTVSQPASRSGTVTTLSSGKSRAMPMATSRQCEAAKGTFKFDLIDAVRKSISRGPVEDDNKECAEKFSIKDEEVRKHLRVVFAIVPDPVHTNLSLFFDRQIDAIQQGITDSGWNFDRALMPWDNKEHPEPDDFRIRVEQKIYQDDQEDQPGLMIFHWWRKPEDSDKILKAPPYRLLVFVVSESPTAGVQKLQFRNAINLVEKLFGKHIPDHLPIFGPTFSGSLGSLAELLLDCKGPDEFCKANKRIYSGTVTGFAQTARFEEITGVPFVSLQENDDYVLKVFVDFASRQWAYSTPKIAIVSEDETSYGARSDTSGLVHIFFPRGIFQLRSAYQHAVNAPAAGGKAPRTTLPLDLESSGSDDYSVPEYSGKQYPLSQEAVLLGIVRDLQEHRARIVVLRATDPLDMVFLSRYLRQAYPDGRIVTISSDLLFSRELEDAGLHGVMALTTYPLTVGADSELQPHAQGQGDWVFPSTHSVGSYNAIKLLLADNFQDIQPPPGNCPKDKPCVHLYQYSWPELKQPELQQPELKPAEATHPPVYLTVLGHEGYWPVAVLPAEQASQLQPPKSSLPEVYDPQSIISIPPPRPPSGWNLFWIAAIVVSIAYVYFIWSASMLSSSQAVAQLAPAMRDSRRYLVALAAYLHFAVLMALLWLYEYQPPLSSSSWPKFFLIATLLLVVVVGTCDLYRRNCLHLAILFALAVLVTPILLWLKLKQDYFHQMSYYRSMHLASGVSDLLSVILFLAAGLWGVWYSFSGSSLLDSSRTQLPKRKNIDKAALNEEVKSKLKSFRGVLEEDQARLSRAIKPDSIDRRTIFLCSIVVFVILLFTRLRPIRAFEPQTHEYLLAALSACSFTFLIAGALRLHSIWIELRRLLIALDNTPLRQGFRRLTGFSWSSLWRLAGGYLGGFRRLITLQTEALGCALNLNIPTITRTVADNFNDQYKKTHNRYDAALNHYLGVSQEDEILGEMGISSGSAPVAVTWGIQDAGAAPALAPVPSSTGKPSRVPALLKRLAWPVQAFRRWLSGVREQAAKENLLLTEFEKLQEQFAAAGLHALGFAAIEWDKATAIANNITNEGQSSGTDAKKRIESSSDVESEKRLEMREAAENFLALLYTSFIAIVLVRIRTLIITIAGMYVLSLLALTTYPFQPQVEIRIFLLLLLVFMITLVGIVYTQMHRDATLINITSTEPAQLKFSLWLRMASFVALPVFSLVASQYPEFGNLLYSWLEPALNALK